MGEPAIEPLARFLLSPPDQHPQPRVLAAEAPGAIGGPRAVQALIAAPSSRDLKPLPLELRLAEEAVHSAIARELERLRDRSAVETLRRALQRDHLVEAGVVLARWGETGDIPPLIDCLEDPFIRDRAAAALREFGQSARVPLLASLARHTWMEGAEARWSIERRAASARLLGEIADPRARLTLMGMLADDAAEVRLAAALALANPPRPVHRRGHGSPYRH
jgi:HEAT repeat protein